MKKLNLTAAAAVAAVVMGTSFVAPGVAQAEMSYNIGLHSQYILRGTGEENSGAAIQGGADYSNESGFYLGYWFSNLGYCYEKGATTCNGATGAAALGDDNKNDKLGWENDFYGGFTGKIGSTGLGYDVGLIQYYYVNVDDSNLTELKAKLTYSDFYIQSQYLLNDGWWGNSGDNYLTAGWSTSLPEGFGLALDYGYYSYDNNDSAKIGGPGTTVITSGFRHLNVKLTKAIGKTGAEGYLQYINAGKTRDGVEHNNSMVVGITYGF